LKPFPKLSETNEIRAFLYELLMRNLRWTDCLHYLLDTVLVAPIENSKRKKILDILAKQEATSAGQTIPSYRIPLLWEALFLELREALSVSVSISLQPIDGSGSSALGAENTSSVSSRSLSATESIVDSGNSGTQRSGNAKKGSSRAKPVRPSKTT
jgi:hypothetical protein